MGNWPEEAIRRAANILQDQLSIFVDLKGDEELKPEQKEEEIELESVILCTTKKELSILEQRVSSIRWSSKLIILDANRQKDGCVKIG